ncbi:MAG: rhomboid family intramembrane serine protease [Bacteroidales bacterium]|nr:rhomboid family intramembrane serine protease [Bacteroidales bacterium]
MIRITKGVLVLLIINIVMLLLTNILQYWDIDLYRTCGLYYYTSDLFNPIQYFTYMFMHGDFSHLIFNMFALVMFGIVLEYIWGTKRFIFYFLVTGIGAALINTLISYIHLHPLMDCLNQFLANPNAHTFETITQKFPFLFKQDPVFDLIDHWAEYSQDNSFILDIKQQVNYIVLEYSKISTGVMVGASGAIFGLLVASAMMFPNQKMYIIFLPIGIPAKYFILIICAIELVLELSNFSGDNIAHWAHLGGAIVGAIIMLIWRKFPFNDFFNK